MLPRKSRRFSIVIRVLIVSLLVSAVFVVFRCADNSASEAEAVSRLRSHNTFVYVYAEGILGDFYSWVGFCDYEGSLPGYGKHAREIYVFQLTPEAAMESIDVKLLAELPNLREVGIYNGALPMKKAEQIAKLESLEVLELQTLRISDRAFSTILTGTKRLRALRLSNTTIGDVAMRDVAKLSDLTELSLTSTKITDRGIRSIVGLTGLRELSVAGTAVTDKCIPDLVKLSNLRILFIAKSRISRAGYDELCRKMKGCDVQR